jgi:transcriptional regulator with XRE-family HTH domain
VGIKRTTEADVQIGKRIRARRESLGLTLQQVAKGLDVSYQQLQKYESGENRVAGRRLQDLASALRISILELLGEGPVSYGNPVPLDGELLHRLIRSYERLPPELQKSVLEIVEALETGRRVSGPLT